MPVLSRTDAATFTRHVTIRAAVRSLGDRRDDLERLARECDSGDLKDALRELADHIGAGINDACLETLIDREVSDTDEDRRDRITEDRHVGILMSPEGSGR